MSGTMTGVFKQAAVPHRPTSGATGSGAIARIHSFGAAGDGAAAYFDTAEALGFLVEAVEPPARMPPTDFTLQSTTSDAT